MKTITTVIKTCRDCPHCDHTGGFTKGGAKLCCSHDFVCRTRGYDCFKRLIRIKKGKARIPAWCPLTSKELKPKPEKITGSLTFGTQTITLSSIKFM